MPRAANRLAWARARSGGVELMSITRAPAAIFVAAFSAPKNTDSTASPLANMAMIVPAPSTAAAALSTAMAPCAANDSALDLLRFHKISRWPAASRLRAMRLPTSPMPRNATLPVDCFIYSFSVSQLDRNNVCEQRASLTKN